MFTARYHSLLVIPMFTINKPVNVKSNTYINSSKEINNKDPKFKVGDNVRISKYKNLFSKDYAPN